MNLTKESITHTLVDMVSKYAGIKAIKVNIDEPITNYGLDSLQSISLSGELESWLNIDIDPTIIWDNPTIAALSNHIYAIYDKND